MANKRSKATNSAPSKKAGRHRPPPVPPRAPKDAPQGRRIKVIDADGHQRMVWEQA